MPLQPYIQENLAVDDFCEDHPEYDTRFPMAGSEPILPGNGSRVLPIAEVTALMTSHTLPGYIYAGTADGSIMKVFYLCSSCNRMRLIKIKKIICFEVVHNKDVDYPTRKRLHTLSNIPLLPRAAAVVSLLLLYCCCCCIVVAVVRLLPFFFLFNCYSCSYFPSCSYLLEL